MTRTISDLNNQITQINASLLEIKNDNKEIKEANKSYADDFKKIKDDISEMKDTIIKNLMKKNRELASKVAILEEQIENMEISNTINIESNYQYGRRNSIEISGILNNVNNDDLEDKVIRILEKIDVKVTKNDIEACHRLPASKKNPTKKLL